MGLFFAFFGTHPWIEGADLRGRPRRKQQLSLSTRNDFKQDSLDCAMADGFSLTFPTYMTPWTQDCMFFVVVTLTEAGIAVEPDPKKRGFGMEEQWFAPWSDVVSFQHVRPPEPIVRVEFPTSEGQTAIRDIRVPDVAAGPFAGCPGPQLVEAMLLVFQEHHRAPAVDDVMRKVAELRPES